MTQKPPAPASAASQPGWLLPAILVGVIAAVLALVAALSGNRSPAFTPEVTGAPRASFDRVSIDHGLNPFGTAVESIFRLRNVGDQPLQILGEPRVELMQGC